MSGKTYIEKKSLLKSVPSNGLVAIKINGEETDSAFSNLEERYVSAGLIGGSSSGTWTPTVVSEAGGEIGYPHGAFTWMKVGNIVSFWGRFQVSAMAIGNTDYQGRLSLPAEVLPNNNWDDVIYINGPVVQIGNVSGTTSFEVLSYDGGGKEMLINITKDSTDTGYTMYISASYSVDN